MSQFRSQNAVPERYSPIANQRISFWSHFGTEHHDKRIIEGFVHDSYDLTPRGIIDGLGLLEVEYNMVFAVARCGNPSVQQYIFDRTSGAHAVQEISGTMLSNYLKLVSYG